MFEPDSSRRRASESATEPFNGSPDLNDCNSLYGPRNTHDIVKIQPAARGFDYLRPAMGKRKTGATNYVPHGRDFISVRDTCFIKGTPERRIIFNYLGHRTTPTVSCRLSTAKSETPGEKEKSSCSEWTDDSGRIRSDIFLLFIEVVFAVIDFPIAFFGVSILSFGRYLQGHHELHV